MSIFVSPSVCYCQCTRRNVLCEMKNQLNCRNCVCIIYCNRRSSYSLQLSQKEKVGN